MRACIRECQKWEFRNNAEHNGHKGAYGLGAESDVQAVMDTIVKTMSEEEEIKR